MITSAPIPFIEYKGPTDELAGEDVLVLLGYAYQYMRRAKLKDPGDVCCTWRFSMRTEDDPEYVPVELTTKPPAG